MRCCGPCPTLGPTCGGFAEPGKPPADPGSSWHPGGEGRGRIRELSSSYILMARDILRPNRRTPAWLPSSRRDTVGVMERKTTLRDGLILATVYEGGDVWLEYRGDSEGLLLDFADVEKLYRAAMDQRVS